MSQENVDAVRRIFDAYNQRDIDLLLSYTADDVVLDWSGSRGPHRGVYRGKAELRAFWSNFVDAWDEFHWEPLEMQGLDPDRVLSANRLTVRGSGSGVELTGQGAIIWTIRNGKALHMKLFQSKPEALEAAGLRE
jgi:ketosteroid isomerase-like protein